ncbi:MAG: hypothetical protein F6K31_22745 [Symploca sp. SIO2G7]|nr:hypothetical protein [Symploca sp. SIO2G7]
MQPYHNHLKSSENLVTTYEATRAGFVTLALELENKTLINAANLNEESQVVSISRWLCNL